MKRLLLGVVAGFVMVFSVVTCGHGGGTYWGGEDVGLYCREAPEDCDGDIGGYCRFDEDCFDGTCCTNKECDHGMCTYLCEEDFDCPDVMACEHGYCYFVCNHDDDCGAGQKCAHDHSVCEYD